MLDIKQLRFSYVADEAPMEFSLSVSPGEVLSIVGPSGAGKSTLINLIAGFLKASAGDIQIDGNSIINDAISRRPVSIVFQQFNLFPHLDIFSNVALGLSPSLRLTEIERQRVSDVLSVLGLSGLEARKPAQLSGGQQQRVALARAMVRDRRVLLLDEAFTALGPSLRKELLQQVRLLVVEHQMMALSISHQPSDAFHISERLAFIDQGRIIEEGSVNDCLNNPRDPVIREYLGSAD